MDLATRSLRCGAEFYGGVVLDSTMSYRQNSHQGRVQFSPGAIFGPRVKFKRSEICNKERETMQENFLTFSLCG